VSESNQRGPTDTPNPKAFIGIGIEMAVTIVVFMYGGYRLDGWLGTAPWLFVSLALLGVAVAFYSFFKRVLPARKDPEG
jgi:F0F1-type ATP synthase assembly protein I